MIKFGLAYKVTNIDRKKNIEKPIDVLLYRIVWGERKYSLIAQSSTTVTRLRLATGTPIHLLIQTHYDCGLSTPPTIALLLAPERRSFHILAAQCDRPAQRSSRY